MSEDKELETWKTEWQSLGGRERLAEELAGRVAKDGKRLRRALAREVVAGVVAVGLSVWLVARTHGELVSAVACAGIVLFTGIWLTRLFWVYEGSLRSPGTGLDAFMDLTRCRLADDLKWIAFSRRATQILAIAIVPWGIWAFVRRYAMYRDEPWRAVVGFGSVALILTGLFVWYRGKQRKLVAELERFEALVAERTLE